MEWHEIPKDLRMKQLRAAAITAAQLARLLAELHQHGDLASLRLLLDRFHRLAAWSALHGLSAIFAAAQSGEHDCSALVGAGIRPQRCHLDQVRALIQVLQGEIRLVGARGAMSDDILWGGQAQRDAGDNGGAPPAPRLVLAPELPPAGPTVPLARMPHDTDWEQSGPDEAAAEALGAGRGVSDCGGDRRGVGGSEPDADLAPAAPEPGSARILYLDADAGAGRAPAVRELLEAAGYRMRSGDPHGFYSTDLTREAEMLLVDLPRSRESAGELVRRLWAYPGAAAVPVVFLTSDPEAPAYAMSVGGAEYLASPAEPRLLLSTVAARLERIRGLKQLFSPAA